MVFPHKKQIPHWSKCAENLPTVKWLAIMSRARFDYCLMMFKNHNNLICVDFCIVCSVSARQPPLLFVPETEKEPFAHDMISSCLRLRWGCAMHIVIVLLKLIVHTNPLAFQVFRQCELPGGFASLFNQHFSKHGPDIACRLNVNSFKPNWKHLKLNVLAFVWTQQIC